MELAPSSSAATPMDSAPLRRLQNIALAHLCECVVQAGLAVWLTIEWDALRGDSTRTAFVAYSLLSLFYVTIGILQLTFTLRFGFTRKRNFRQLSITVGMCAVLYCALSLPPIVIVAVNYIGDVKGSAEGLIPIVSMLYPFLVALVNIAFVLAILPRRRESVRDPMNGELEKVTVTEAEALPEKTPVVVCA